MYICYTENTDIYLLDLLGGEGSGLHCFLSTVGWLKFDHVLDCPDRRFEKGSGMVREGLIVEVLNKICRKHSEQYFSRHP